MLVFRVLLAKAKITRIFVLCWIGHKGLKIMSNIFILCIFLQGFQVGFDRLQRVTNQSNVLQVHYNESQIGIGHLIMDESAKKYVDQPRYLYDLNLLFAVPKPKPLPPVLNTLRPFPALLWGSICITVAISGMVIAMIYCCQERLFKKNVNPDVSVPIFWLFACLTSQSKKYFRTPRQQ